MRCLGFASTIDVSPRRYQRVCSAWPSPVTGSIIRSIRACMSTSTVTVISISRFATEYRPRRLTQRLPNWWPGRGAPYDQFSRVGEILDGPQAEELFGGHLALVPVWLANGGQCRG